MIYSTLKRKVLTAMENNQLIEVLTRLLQVDFDAVYSYDQALPKIEDAVMRSRLTEFRHSHQLHIHDLSEAIRRMGAEPPEVSNDFRGFFMGGVSALRSLSGTKGALKALQSVEEMTNREYGEVVSWKAPDDIRELLRKQFTDVKIHLDYISSNLQALNTSDLTS